MERLIDWERRLADYMNAVPKREFKWGSFDPLFLADGAIEALTGEAVFDDFRGKYHDEESALAYFKEVGSNSLYNVLRHHLKDPVAGVWGQRGDIAYLAKSCGVIVGRYAVFVGAGGTAHFSIRHIEKAFKVRF